MEEIKKRYVVGRALEGCRDGTSGECGGRTASLQVNPHLKYDDVDGSYSQVAKRGGSNNTYTYTRFAWRMVVLMES